MKIKTGAGVIPFAIKNRGACFLFHKTFSGRRAGHLVDFGGGSRVGETQMQTAAREFVEETEAMFFAKNCDDVDASPFRSQYQRMLKLIEETQNRHPHWYCGRKNRVGEKPRNWKTYFVEVEYKDPADMNTAWAQESSGRFKKQRELNWLTAEQLLDIIDNRPEAFWKRIREYEGMHDVVQSIVNDRTRKLPPS